jgi:hypothetical protein
MPAYLSLSLYMCACVCVCLCVCHALHDWTMGLSVHASLSHSLTHTLSLVSRTWWLERSMCAIPRLHLPQALGRDRRPHARQCLHKVAQGDGTHGSGRRVSNACTQLTHRTQGGFLGCACVWKESKGGERCIRTRSGQAYTRACRDVCVCVYVCVCECLGMCVCMRVHICMHVHLSVCVCVCMCADGARLQRTQLRHVTARVACGGLGQVHMYACGYMSVRLHARMRVYACVCLYRTCE